MHMLIDTLLVHTVLHNTYVLPYTCDIMVKAVNGLKALLDFSIWFPFKRGKQLYPQSVCLSSSVLSSYMRRYVNV